MFSLFRQYSYASYAIRRDIRKDPEFGAKNPSALSVHASMKLCEMLENNPQETLRIQFTGYQVTQK